MDKEKHFYDACYEVWRNGGNPDLVDRDRSDDDWYYGHDPDYTACEELHRQREFPIEYGDQIE